MNRILLLIFLCGLCAGSLHAVHIGYLCPSGGQQGTTVELVIGGQQYWGIKGGMVSGEGVTVESVEVVRWFPHPPWKQRKYLVDWLNQIRKGNPEKPPLPEKPEDLEGWHKHPYWEKLDRLTPQERELMLRFLFLPRNPLQMSPAISSIAIARIRIDADAKAGEREFRLISNGGLSNPLRFFVDRVPEIREPYFPLPPDPQETASFSVPCVLNGQILPGETDSFRFKAGKGEEICFAVTARELMPFIGDGVPGHFQPVLEVTDSNGRSLAFADDHYFHPDPVLRFRAPEAGEYTLSIRDAIYRGREDFVYRIRVSEYLDPYRIGEPPPFPIAAMDADSIPADSPVRLPVMIRGAIAKEGGMQSFRFFAEKGGKRILEIFARRLNSPLDSLLRVYDDDGKQIAWNDDFKRIKAGSILHPSADSYLVFTAPETGEYRVTVSDTAGKGGRDYVYFLRMDVPRPRFTVYCTPSASDVAMVGAEPLKIFVERQDGFDGEIRLRLKNSGDYSIVGIGTVPRGCDQTVITLGTRPSRRPVHREVRMTAASEQFKTDVIPADESMQAFAYTHLVPAQKMYLMKRWKYAGAEKFSWSSKESAFRLNPSVKLSVAVQGLPPGAEADLVPVDPPEWLKTGKTEKTADRITLEIRADAGAGGKKSVNQLFKVVYKYDGRPDKEGKVRRYTSDIILPAVRLETGDQ